VNPRGVGEVETVDRATNDRRRFDVPQEIIQLVPLAKGDLFVTGSAA